MGELTVSQLIKLIIGALVVVAVVVGVSMVFNSKILPFFRDIGGNSTATKIFFNLLK